MVYAKTGENLSLEQIHQIENTHINMYLHLSTGTLCFLCYIYFVVVTVCY